MEEKSDYKSEYSELRRVQEMIFGRKKQGLPIKPYFVYEVGETHHPYHLCFPNEPTIQRYENDIFNLLITLPSVGEAINCLKYHLERYPSRDEFLEFFQHELSARMEKYKSLTNLVITYKECLKWIEGQMIPQLPVLDQSYLLDRIQTNQRESLIILFKYLISELDGSTPPEYGFKGSHLGIAMLLRHFTSCDNTTVSTLQKEVLKCDAKRKMPPGLEAELRKFFKQWIEK
ncbi:hypothetical protein [Telluribacter sp.]|jgi:hypothetical protein|uniref:hypothetical protein n=1 Tax=Telluribacter sp. TaxID=1978767 RepID=UPI002E15881C|nr:hypothetical protein [Telluribacter sp.]